MTNSFIPVLKHSRFESMDIIFNSKFGGDERRYTMDLLKCHHCESVETALMRANDAIKCNKKLSKYTASFLAA